jgi:hypothetical protein
MKKDILMLIGFAVGLAAIACFTGFSYQQGFAMAFMLLAGVTIILINRVNPRFLSTVTILTSFREKR